MKLFFDIQAKRRLYSQNGVQISTFRAILTDGTVANILFRMQSGCSSVGLLPLSFFFHTLNKIFNGCVIGVGARFGGGLVLIHPVGVVINSSVTGGENILIESSVVIGDNHGMSPTLGNNIFIGSGAKILGGVHVSNNAFIGANAVVLKNVPENTTAVGVPAKSHPNASRRVSESS